MLHAGVANGHRDLSVMRMLHVIQKLNVYAAIHPPARRLGQRIFRLFHETITHLRTRMKTAATFNSTPHFKKLFYKTNKKATRILK